MIFVFAITLVAVGVMAYRELDKQGDLAALKQWILSLDERMQR